MDIGTREPHELTMLSFAITYLVGMAFIIPHIENTPIENITDDLSEEYGDMDETKTEAPVYANVEKRLFEDLLQDQTKEERLNTIKELKEKNLKDQTRRRALRRRRKAKHNGRKGRFNRNIKRYCTIALYCTLYK